MKTKKILILLIASTFLFTQCGMKKLEKQSMEKFSDQYFKTAIALIELHKIRFGEYPETLDSLKFIGDWDQMIFTSVKYQKLDKGYELDLTNDLFGKPDSLEYPAAFWEGLGLVRSNMKK
ncbi:hypothetical protein A3860_38950 [Niastella vici]|uniref:Uncharacterized protein n=1 Tax=Niastella vici TaxID=1703345 RepID=A0A1V9FLB7_9BACT|nr:hypothetical protein [Niastella vici]OQP59087.1 hypothetical protein A3860_38950 [Niastella vici]